MNEEQKKFLEKIRGMNVEDLRILYETAITQVGAGIEQRVSPDKMEFWFRVIEAITRAPAYNQIHPRVREQLAKDLKKRVFLASYNLIEPGEFVLEKILLKRNLTIKGKSYKTGWYKVPEEMDKGLACWLVDKGFAEMGLRIVGCEPPEELHKINKLLEKITGVPLFFST